ncbi:hypothetical protein [Lolliginicoccus levis]|uniref:hypothetical protein n=1 Tax=Lolliginicoccus levis TaxID=2919542 RepID=UPI00241D2DE2|nr:hypothetical protein [Lolliginicoccus levis]
MRSIPRRRTPFGTRGNPVPLGTSVELGPNWQVNVVSVTPGTTPQVLVQNQFNEQFPGATREANQCWSVPSEAVAGGVILIEESLSFEDTRVFFQGG